MKKVIAIVGPTATGKSNLAVRIAKKFKGEIISADSRQIYKGLDIGTGKITKREMRGIPHYLLSFFNPKKTYSAYDFAEKANKLIRKIKLPIIAGGTGFWIDALANPGLLAETGPNLRLRKQLEKKTTAQLYSQLKRLAPKRPKTIQKTNKRRLIRAVEIALAPHTKQNAVSNKSIVNFDILWLGLTLPNPQLKEKIQKRFMGWLKRGLIDEARRLRQNVSAKRLKEIGLMYPIIEEYLDKKISKEQMIERSVNSIYHYAKRQKTWFKRNNEIHWIKNNKRAQLLVNKFIKNKF